MPQEQTDLKPPSAPALGPAAATRAPLDVPPPLAIPTSASIPTATSSDPLLSPPLASPPLSSAPPPASPRRRFVIPPTLLHPGMEMLKVSAKSAQRVKTRKMWLEVGTDDDNGEVELLGRGLGMGEGHDVRICWEKSGRGGTTKREASVAISALRDLRFGTSGSPYRTSLHLSPLLEPRWLTLIYLAPSTSPSPLSPLSSILSSTTTPSYKLVHFIAPSEEDLELWKTAFERLREGRNGVPGLGEVEDAGAVGEEKVVQEEEVHRLCARLGMGMGREEVGAAFRKSAAPKDSLDFAAFQKFVKLLKKREDIEEIFKLLVGRDDGLTLTTWSTFLMETQQTSLAPLAIANLHSKYADPATHIATLEGFSAFLLSSDNPAIKDDTQQDMTRPLSEYYISSSHNTYLVGNQLQGDSTIEGYIRALQQGCRCVELDVWSGDEGFPIITHGRTLTSSISVHDALAAIAQYAFLASSFPLILSLEIHCDLAQQEKLVEILKETLAERLVVTRLDGGVGEVDKLPSPWELRGKVLLKAKNLFVTNAAGTEVAGPVEMEISSTESSASSDSDFKRVLKAVRGSFTDRRPSVSSANSSTIPAPSSRRPSPSSVTKLPMSLALASLIIYTVGVKARGFNKKEKYAPTHVLSFGENRCEKMIKGDGVRNDFVSHNRAHLTRVYPKGFRVNSTNYCPHHLWAVGVQMAAINWQTFDTGMQLNAAMFARAGRSGYVLKPELLRRKGPEKDKESLVKTANFALELEVISAQQLPRSRDALAGPPDVDRAPMDPFIEITLFVPGLPLPLRRRTKIISGNAFNPLFASSFLLPFVSHPSLDMLDLAFLRLEVLNARGNPKAATEEGKGVFVGAYTTSVGGLLGGYRHLPLYDAVGDQHLFSTLFVRTSVRRVEELAVPV